MLSVRKRFIAISAVVVAASMTVPATSAAASTSGTSSSRGTASTSDAPASVVSAYFADWDVYGRGYFVKDIPADKINVIQYAFGVPGFDPAAGSVSCNILDPWADYQQVYWTGDNTVDGVADDPNNPDQHLFGNFNQLAKLKAAHPNLKIEISLGGWTKSTWFADLAATPQRRAQFVSACIDTFIKGNLPGGGWPASAGGPGAAAGLFDGIDLDWEYPTQAAGGNIGYSPADRHNATLLAAEFRKQLNAYGATTGKHYLLTAALPAASSATKYYELGAISKYLDWDNVMTYDYNVPGGTVAGPDTLMRWDPRDPNSQDWTWNTTGTVVNYLLNDVPANKVVVGVPFYGNQYINVSSNAAHGLYGTFDNTGLDSNSLATDITPQPTYHDLVDVSGLLTSNGTGAGGYTAYWDQFAGEPYLASPNGSHALASGTISIPTVITYTNPTSVGERTELIESLHLRGAMVWEISQDSDSHALIGALSPLLD
jgi:chitinase